jgi:hypothetical protein
MIDRKHDLSITKQAERLNARDEENYYRGLLEAAQKGIENAKAFLEAVA